ncbi:uracil permease [Ruminiclostridium sufflavum DSM 19573]|uniref:Uracil permease n=1 Tax=Ruminiclostridium sufflavum DSM 19573 TaxID=1121337 RepID=A0A318XNF3_9FIRM|nr:uracil permease [Ruminiclostridium sufflavum]PYG88441.1 uracil permease [Ruminiclostridium sufflavum DSM 19573]
MNNTRPIIQVEEKVPFLKALPLSFQHLFAMFSASVLVPFLFNSYAKDHYLETLKLTLKQLNADQLATYNGIQVIDPALVLLLNGIGTLIYIFICKGRAPAFLGSSFAFLSPTSAIITSSSNYADNFRQALGGYIICGLVFVIVAFIIGKVGTGWLDVVLPPAAMGPIVALIGLELAGSAADMAGLLPDANGGFNIQSIIISMVTLAVLIIGNLCFRGFLSVIPILLAVIAGYVLSAIMGNVDYSAVSTARWFDLPAFVAPSFKFNAILILAPAALVVLSEHIGHLFVTGNIVGRNLTKDPGLHRSLMGDGLSTMLSGFCGSCPTTTYGENMGVMAITRVYSVWVIGGAGVISIIIAFVGKLSGIISSIPAAVMGGVSLLLFGTIAASGIRMIVEAKIDYSKAKNLVLTALVFVTGISGITVNLGQNVKLSGMVLATLAGMALSLVFYVLDKLKLTNDAE